MTTDIALTQKYLNGDIGTFTELVDIYLEPTYAFIYRLCGNAEDASDITQETFVKVWKNLSKYDPAQSFKTWLFTIARNTTIDWFRKRKSIPFSSMEHEESDNFGGNIVDTEPLAHELFEKAEIGEKVKAALDTLPVDQRAVVTLHYEQEMTFEEISKILDKSVNTVKSQYRRALMKMKQVLNNAPF